MTPGITMLHLTRVFMALGLISTLLAAAADNTSAAGQPEHALSKRFIFADSYSTYIHKRHAHGCIMSIVFIVLLPLGAIMLHLPLRPIPVITRLHAPIQLLALALLIGAMGLGIDIARNDIHYLGPGSGSTPTHIIFGLVICCCLILFQPALGILQHLHFRKHGNKSLFGHVHRWLGRALIVCGWANSCLGFELVGWEFIKTHNRVRNFVIMGILGGLWWGLIGVNAVRRYVMKRDAWGGYGVRLSGSKLIVQKPESSIVEEEKGTERVGERI